MISYDSSWNFVFSALCFRRSSEIIQPHPPRGQPTLDKVRAREWGREVIVTKDANQFPGKVRAREWGREGEWGKGGTGNMVDNVGEIRRFTQISADFLGRRFLILGAHFQSDP